MTAYQKFKALPIDHDAIGLEQRDNDVTYYCTPKDAHIIGWAGVDGIHYCTIPEFGETIFAASPMNFGDCVHPIARNFEDLLSLLLFCGDMAALEQCYAWDEEQFKAFLIDCPVTEKQKAVLDVIQKEFGIEPIADAFAYVKQLQREFDLSKIPYTEDYYDPDMNAAAPEQEQEWKVSFDGGFWGGDGKPGREVPIGKAFRWGSEKWYIPAAYICDEGLVLDYCKEADPAEVKAFIDKWDLANEYRNHYTKEQQEQMQREHPLNAHFYGRVTCNWEDLQNGHGCGVTWLPASCVPDGIRPDDTAKGILTHYSLEGTKGWAFQRQSYPWGNAAGHDLYALTVRMERQQENIAGQHFITPAVGEPITLTHPLTGETYTLTVHETEQRELPERLFPDANMEYPNHLLAISYCLEPDITGRGFLIQDCAAGDSPRRKQHASQGEHTVFATAIGVIGGADGPSAVTIGAPSPKLHGACSSLYFQPVENVEWRAVFSEKLMEDIEICLI